MTAVVGSMYRLCLLGKPKLLGAAAGEIVLPEKSYLLLALLATKAAAALDRESVRRLLWHSETPEKRAGSLRQLLSRIDQSIGPDRPALLAVTRTHLALNTAEWDVDILLLKDARPPLSAAAHELLRGDLLDMAQMPTQGAEDWLTFERQRIAEHRALLLNEILDDPEAQTDADLLLFAGRLIEIDSSYESAYRALMLAHTRQGDSAAARQDYLKCKARLKADFETEPEARTTELARSLGIVAPARPRVIEPMATISPSGEQAGQPRIVILPPESMLSDPLMSRIGRALLEEVTIGLSQQRGFKIIAAHTSLELLNRSIDPASFEAQSADLKFDYSVYVTLRGTDDDVLATCRLTRLADSDVLWAIDLPLAIHRINDSFAHLSRRIVTSLTDTIEREELRRPMQDVAPSAYRLYLEGKRLLAKTDLQQVRQARKLFRASLQRCDNFAPSHAGISRSLSLEWLVRFMRNKDMLSEAKNAALLARENDPNSGRVFRELGFISLYQRRFEESLDFFCKAQDLSPNDADVLADHADALSHDGQLDRALALSTAAFRLNPLPSDHYYWQIGGIYFVQEDYERAVEVMEPVKSRPATARLLAAAYAMAGDIAQARYYAEIVLENFPDFRTEHLWHFVPDRQPGYTKLLIEGLNRAGLQ